MLLAILLFASLFILIALGVPIAFSLAGAVLIGLLVQGNPAQFVIISQRMFTAVDSFTLMAIPFFVLAGNLMSSGGISRRLVAFIKLLLRRVPAASPTITTTASAFFGAISGSSPATVAAIGGIMVPSMIEEGYEKEDASAIAASSGSLGVVIPPSIPMVTFAVTASCSVSAMFMGGIIPGILLALVMITVHQVLYRHVEKAATDKITFKMAWSIFTKAIWALGMPAIILGGIYGGIFTPTEAGCVACVYSLFVALFIYKDMRLKDIPKVFVDSALSTAAILLTVSLASPFAWLMTSAGVPKLIAGYILDLNSKVLILLVLNIFLLFLGCFMETQSIILLVTPILLPIAEAYGIHPVALGIIIVVNTAIGMITPPMAPNLYIGNRIAGTNNVGKTSAKMIPYLVVCCAVLLLITYVPEVILMLPRSLGMI